LKDAENAVNSLESRFDLAYSAAHALDVDERLVADSIEACGKVAAKIRALPPHQ